MNAVLWLFIVTFGSMIFSYAWAIIKSILFGFWIKRKGKNAIKKKSDDAWTYKI